MNSICKDYELYLSKLQEVDEKANIIDVGKSNNSLKINCYNNHILNYHYYIIHDFKMD